ALVPVRRQLRFAQWSDRADRLFQTRESGKSDRSIRPTYYLQQARRQIANKGQTARRRATHGCFSLPIRLTFRQQLLARFSNQVVQNDQASQRTVPLSAVVGQALRFLTIGQPKLSPRSLLGCGP